MKVNRLTPNFEVSDIRKTVRFYQDNLGFNLVMAVPETQDGIEKTMSDDKDYYYVVMQRGDVEFMFEKSDKYLSDAVFLKTKNIGASVSFYMEVEGIESFYNKIKSKELETTELKQMWYGMREFYMKDINGYVLGFAEKVE